MKRSALAARLIEARNNSERKKLLAANSTLADVRLARELKDYCYRVWTSEPANARKAAVALTTLTEFSPDKETGAMARWVNGIADITSGKLESAIKNLDSASRLLSRLDREHESAQPMVARLIALAMLGRYEAAQRTGEKALRIFKKYNDQLAAGKIEMNLSNVVSRRDQYKLAERYCLSAYRRFKTVGEKSWQTMAENGLANTYAELNDFKRAEEFYARALKSASAARMHVTVAEIEASIGTLALFRGRYGEAVRRLELSRQKYEKLRMPHQTAVAELEIADIYAELNLNSEAFEIYQRLIPTLHRLKIRAEEARARANFGRALIAAENFSGARRELKRAAELFEREKNATASAAVHLRLASLEHSQGKFAEALTIANRSAAMLDKGENIRLRLSALWLRGDILANLRQFDEAENLLNRGLREAKTLEQPAIARAVMNSLGVIARETGEMRKAETMFEAAIDAAEAARAPLPGEEFRIAFLARSLEPFKNLSRLYIAQGDIEKAFVAVERARSRSLLDAVGNNDKAPANSAVAKLREELNWSYSRLGRAEEGEIPKLQRQIERSEKKLTDVERRARSISGSETTNHFPKLDLAHLQKQLGPRKALIEFIDHAGIFSAFVITENGVEYFDALAHENEIRPLLEGLHFQFGSLRFGVRALEAFATQLKTRTDSYLQKLYEKLLEPVMRLVGEKDLVIVPAGVLNYVPFHGLFDGERYAIETREVVYAPSAAIWKKLNSRRVRAPKNALLMAYADERIPLADSEVTQLSKMLPNAVKFAGKQATFASFQKYSPHFDLIHLACHGQFQPDNPMFSSLHLADGWVTVRDVCARRLNAQLVTLSACETGLNKIFAGDEILGLARGFLSAGARSLLLSLWTVNDAATATLMRGFYDNLQRGTSVSASLRIAQKDFIGRGEHPYYWSPFFVIV